MKEEMEMTCGRIFRIIMLMSLLTGAIAFQVTAGGTASNPIPADGAVVAPDVTTFGPYMLLQFAAAPSAVSHTGYFSDTYSDVAARDPAHSLGSPPYPPYVPTGYYVGLDEPEVPHFARAPLERGKTYFWCVDEFDGQTTWPGDVWAFTVMTQKAWNPDPPNASTDVRSYQKLTLRWRPGDVAPDHQYSVRYEVYFGTDSNHVSTGTTPDADIKRENHEVSGLAPNTTYFWRVDTVETLEAPPYEVKTFEGDLWSFRTSDNTIYVDDDATGANDGSSWPNAHKYLQDALADANSATKPLEIRVAQGIYKPDESTLHPNGTGNRQAAFELINGVTLRGGYVGLGSPNPNERDIATYETILSGDLDANDARVNDFNDMLEGPTWAENSHNVVVCGAIDKTAVLDGVTVTAGNANVMSKPHTRAMMAGGIYIAGGSPIIMNCTIRGNFGLWAGALFNAEFSEPNFTNCSLSGNFSSSGMGGAANMPGTRPIFTRCRFSENRGGLGGGMSNLEATLLLDRCVFADNMGGGVGAIYNAGQCEILLLNCSFIRNRSNWAVVLNEAGVSVEMIGCVLSGNVAHDDSVILSDDSTVSMKSCSLTGNAAPRGNIIVNFMGVEMTLTNCTISGNRCGRELIFEFSSPQAAISNSILWRNQAGQLNPATRITYSLVEGGWPGVGNFDWDPLFVREGYWDPNGTSEDTSDDFWVEGDYHVQPRSACTNKGDPAFVEEGHAIDMDGEKRVMLSRVDIGADEFNPFTLEFVVVSKKRVDRSVFEYECGVALTNISRFAIENVFLEAVQWSGNMEPADPNVTFDNARVSPGASIQSLDTCRFTVDRSEPIDPTEIVWHVSAELPGTGAKMQHTVSATLLPEPLTDFDGLKAIAQKWLWQGTAGGISADTVRDGTVNLADFTEFAETWLKK